MLVAAIVPRGLRRGIFVSSVSGVRNLFVVIVFVVIVPVETHGRRLKSGPDPTDLRISGGRMRRERRCAWQQ
jgi:hypothetical protein